MPRRDSVDVLVGPDGSACAAVPRSRDKTDSGIVVACHILDRPDLSRLAVGVAAAVGPRGIPATSGRTRSDPTGGLSAPDGVTRELEARLTEGTRRGAERDRRLLWW